MRKTKTNPVKKIRLVRRQDECQQQPRKDRPKTGRGRVLSILRGCRCLWMPIPKVKVINPSNPAGGQAGLPEPGGNINALEVVLSINPSP